MKLARHIVTYVHAYSGISDSGRSEIRTISLQRTQLEVPKYFLPIVPIYFGLPHKGQPPYKGQNDCPKVSFIWRFHFTYVRTYIHAIVLFMYCMYTYVCTNIHTYMHTVHVYLYVINTYVDTVHSPLSPHFVDCRLTLCSAHNLRTYIRTVDRYVRTYSMCWVGSSL